MASRRGSASCWAARSSPALAALVSSAASVGSPATSKWPSVSVSAVSLQSRPASSTSRAADDGPGTISPAGPYPTPLTRDSPPPATSRCTVISFCVSVPVLSVQMTIVLPSVSTAGSLRMIARRFAIRFTPMASVTVTAAGRPSGIAATARAIDALNISTRSSPRTSPTTNVSTASTTITTSRTLENWSILRVSGVLRSCACWISWLILPTSVPSPVATTRPAPVP